ncbi:MAG: DUF1616 domain-containing protein [Nitrososphaerota archaeon]|jgi:uncharacterized membrane protein|nr:DUF1616 domain-containing protein [Nitrososphaerota archaeon]
MKPLQWIETIVFITVLTILATYLIPPESILSYVRITLATIFVFFIPGNCLVNILFRKRNKIDTIEKTVLSVALSFGIAGITGLFLGLTPIGLNFVTITASLSSITLILAITAFTLKNKDIKNPEQQKTSAKDIN